MINSYNIYTVVLPAHWRTLIVTRDNCVLIGVLFLFVQEEMKTMRKSLHEQLGEHFNIGKRPNEKKRQVYKEKLSQRDLEDLMGVRNRGLTRGAGGAWKQRY
jgi:hypothetical protein